MLFFVPGAFADDAALPAEAVAAEVRPAAAEPKPLRFLGAFSTRGVLSNLETTNPLVNGQVVGTLGGTNSTTTGEKTGAYTEERLAAFMTWTPDLLDGRAALDAAFEIDFAWGDQSYATGGNTGGAFGGDQVNLQTRRLDVRLQLAKGHTVVIGQQFVGDSVNDPGTARLDELTRSGGRLMFWGSEAAGIAAYGKFDVAGSELLRYRAGSFTLYEQAFADGDDVTLFVGDVQLAPAYATRVGLHGWFLRDRAGGAAGIVGSGPSSALSELQGGPRLDFRSTEAEVAPEVDTDLLWLAADGGYNAGLDLGPAGLHAVVATNLGKIYVADHGDVDVAGALVDIEGRYRYAAGSGSVARLELLASTGDADGDDTYSGVLTGNTWGIVGAFYATHGCYLLFPDTGAINREVAVVADVSGGGAGVIAATGSLGYDLVPERFNVTLGGGYARSTNGDVFGTEANLKLSAHPFPLGTVSLIGAGVFGAELPATPWTALLSFDWLVLG
ncbi:hypothetical protein LBMAG42_34200 [Deltaproteobacteria bacterium]|nr:hypothetical protein LBMAG42_34200 [Deltaproteobacteria bacterium]